MSKQTNYSTSQSFPSIQSLFPAANSASETLESGRVRVRDHQVSIGSLFPPNNSEPSTSIPTADRTQNSLNSIGLYFPPAASWPASDTGSVEIVQGRVRNDEVSIGSLFPPKNSEPGTWVSTAEHIFAHDSSSLYFPPAASWPASVVGAQSAADSSPPAQGASVDPEVKRSTLPQQELPLSLLLKCSFQSLGIIYGDLGTAPLYVFNCTFPHGVEDPEDVIGALSLIIYSLFLIPLLKYIFIVCKANDNGQGGALAMYSLLCRHANLKILQNYHRTDEEVTTYSRTTTHEGLLAAKTKKYLEKTSGKTVLLILVLIATSTLIGDGILTPGVVVLAACEGIRVNNPYMSPDLALFIAIAIIVVLFSLQKFGMDRVGWLFAPIVLLWFLLIGGIGAFNVLTYDTSVLKAFSPWYAYKYLRRLGSKGWNSLGGIMLCIAGTEALFANLGYFPVSAVQIAFALIVFPTLVLSYIGQAAFIMDNNELTYGAFYLSIPVAVYWPTFITATAAAIIASQASILAAYSAITQALALGCFPRVKVVHTSKKFLGQVYVPDINWILLICCIVVTISFRYSVRIGDAYGAGVLLVMLVTTLLTSLIMILVWRWHWSLVLLFTLFFLGIEGVYFSSVLFKIVQGGWVSIVIAGALFLVMYVWSDVTAKIYDFGVQSSVSIPWLLGLGPSLGLVRVPGIGLVYSEQATGVPQIFSHLITNLPAVHSVVVFVHLKHIPVYSVPEEERFLVSRVGPKSFRMLSCVARYGYNETHKKDDGFEDRLFQSLFLFLRLENIIEGNSGSEEENACEQHAEPSRGVCQNDNERSTDSTEDDSILQVEPSAQTGNNGLSLLRSSRRRDSDEVKFLAMCRDAGVVHILGNTVVRARGDSSLLNKVAVDYIYGFLRKISRERNVIFNVPQESLLNVGQVISL